MKKLLLIPLIAFFGVIYSAPQANAQSLKIAPLEYTTTLKQGEKKKGYIDVSNPTDKSVIIQSSVQSFKQLDNEGSLQFYDNSEIKDGLLVDLDDFELGPKQAVRVYFQLDSNKLPSGDLFMAVFFSASPPVDSTGSSQTVQLGTIFSVTNGTPGARNATITKLSTPWLQLGDRIEGQYAIKNTGDPDKTTGFYPTVQLKVAPLGEITEQKSKLVFAGRERANQFSLKAPLIGIYNVSATYGSEGKSKWVVVARPVMILGAAGALLAAFVGYKLIRRYKRRNRPGLTLK